MGLFSWFKKKQVEAQTANLDVPLGKSNQQELDREAIVLWHDMGRNDHEGNFHEETPKIKLKAIFSNSTLTVFLPGGDILTNTGATKELFTQVQNAFTEADVRTLMLDISMNGNEKELAREILSDQQIVDALPDIVGTGEFTERLGSLYLNGIDVSIPRLLALEIIKAGKEDTSDYYDSLKNFWCWCVLNPDNVAREDLFGFLERGDFKITKNGFFLGYRNVVKQGSKKKQNASLTAFISDKYLNIKTKQKKSPKNYWVFGEDNGTYSLHKDDKGDGIISLKGNLAELYGNLSTLEDNDYTDAHTHSMSIKIGVPVKMERDQCDNDPHSECSRGLHIGNKSFGYQSFGNRTILVAVNPMNVVAVPSHDSNKMRVCEYMPLGVLEGDRTWLEDADSLSIEEEYAIEEAQDLYELATSTGVTEINAKQLLGGNSLVNQVVSTLDIGGAISGRVKEV